jgi:hypothetical protein
VATEMDIEKKEEGKWQKSVLIITWSWQRRLAVSAVPQRVVPCHDSGAKMRDAGVLQVATLACYPLHAFPLIVAMIE